MNQSQAAPNFYDSSTAGADRTSYRDHHKPTMDLDTTNPSAAPPIHQGFPRSSLSDTRRPATSAGVAKQADDILPGTNTLTSQADQMYTPTELNGAVSMDGRMASMNSQDRIIADSELSRRSSLGLSTISEQNQPNRERQSVSSVSPAFSMMQAGPPGSSGGIAHHNNMLRRESDANYAGVFAHSVEDANVPHADGRRSSGTPVFNNPFSGMIDQSLMNKPRPGSQTQNQNVRFQTSMAPPSGLMGGHLQNIAAAAAHRRASEPHYQQQNNHQEVHNPSGLYKQFNFPTSNTGSLSMRDLHITQDRPDMPLSAPISSQSLYQQSPMYPPNSAPPGRSDSHSAYPGYNRPPSYGQQYPYGMPQFDDQQLQQQQRRRSTQGATTGYYSGSPGATQLSDGARRPSVVDTSRSAGYGHETRHSLPGGPQNYAQHSAWSGFPPNYKLGDNPLHHRSSGSGPSSSYMQASPQQPGGYQVNGGYPDPNASLSHQYVEDRNNSYSTASTQSRQSFEARMSNGAVINDTRRDSDSSSLDGYSNNMQDSATGPTIKKRPRRRFDQIERLYPCRFEGCEKSYGTLNHLNAHVSMQKHGIKRKPEEFKDVRKAWRKKKKDEARLAAEAAQRTGVMDPVAAEAMAWEAEGKWLAH